MTHEETEAEQREFEAWAKAHNFKKVVDKVQGTFWVKRYSDED